jgi:hypothetical protein
MDWMMIGQLLYLIIGPILGILAALFITRRVIHRGYPIWGIKTGLLAIFVVFSIGQVYFTLVHRLTLLGAGIYYLGEFDVLPMVGWWISIAFGFVLFILISGILLVSNRKSVLQHLWHWPRYSIHWAIGILALFIITWSAYILIHQIQRVRLAERLRQTTRPIVNTQLRDLGSVLLPGQFSIFGEPNYVVEGGINFSPDSRWLSLILSDGTVEIRRVRDLRICKSIKSKAGQKSMVAFSRDSALISIWMEKKYPLKELTIYHLGDCDLNLVWQDPIESDPDIVDIAFSPDGSHLILVNSVGVYDVNWITEDYSDDYVFIPPGNNYPVALSEDGKYLATYNETFSAIRPFNNADKGTIRIYDLFEKQIISTDYMGGYKPPNHSGKLEFLSNRELFFRESIYPVLKLHFSDLLSGQTRSALINPQSNEYSAQNSMAISPDGRLFVLGLHGNISIWELATAEIYQKMPIAYPSTAIRFSPDMRYLLVATYDGRLSFFDKASIGQ